MIRTGMSPRTGGSIGAEGPRPGDVSRPAFGLRRPGQCKPPFGGEPNARTKLPTFAIQRPLQPVHVLARGADKLEPSDLQRRQLECKKIGVPGTEVSEIHQRQVGPELLIARDAFVVVQEITAAIEDEPVLVHLSMAVCKIAWLIAARAHPT